MNQKFQDYIPISLSTFVGLFLLVLYGSMISNELTWVNNGLDGGDFLAAILSDGIPHPSGYPVYLIFGKLFQLIPYGTPYFKGSLFSAISAALAAAIISYGVGRLHKTNRFQQAIAILVSGLTFGTTSIFWAQAVIVEVYGFQALITSCAILWFQIILTEEYSKRIDHQLMGLALMSGLGLGNHLTTIFLVPAFFYSLVIARKNGYPIHNLLRYIGFSMIGSLSYLYLIYLAQSYPPVNWGNPQDLSGLFWVISGQLYHRLGFNLLLNDGLSRVSAVCNYILDDYGWLGVLAGIIGAVYSFSWKQPLKIIYGWIFIVYIIFAINYSTNDSIAYIIPSLSVISIWIGYSVFMVSHIRFKTLPVGMLGILVLLILCILKIPSIKREVDPRRDISAAKYAEKYLSEAPLNAILVTQSDQDTFPLWYYHYGLKYRQDIIIIVASLVQFDWYQDMIVHNYPEIKTFHRFNNNWSAAVDFGVANHPVCYSRIENLNPITIDYQCY